MAMAPMPPSTAGVTTIDCLRDDNIDEILLRLPSSASLTRAALASRRWRRIASNAHFLRRFRRRHATPDLLGIFASHVSGTGHRDPPIFHLAGPARSDPDLAAVARRGDFLLTGLEVDDDREWHLRDCSNGRLLLSRDNSRSLSICDPISSRCTTVSRPGDDDIDDPFIMDCLLCGRGGDGSFRVVSVQRHSSGQMLRAVEYDSSTLEWRFHPWSTEDNIPAPERDYLGHLHHQSMPMHAAGLVFSRHVYRYNNQGTSRYCLLQLDTTTMEFSVLALPASLTSAELINLVYAVGETAYGACCLACVDVRGMFQVWVLTEDCAGGRTWELEKEMGERRLVPEGCVVSSVTGGVVLVRSRIGRGQFAIDLIDLTTKTKFLCYGLGYAMATSRIGACCLY